MRNYEEQGILPPAARSPAGHRVYTAVHAAALHAFRALVAALGHAAAGDIVRAVGAGDLDTALHLVDAGHERLARDRSVLDAVAASAGHLAAEPPAATGTFTVGDLARRLGVVPATLRKWERAGILRPARDPRTAHRIYRAEDVRDADLAHLLRRGGYPLAHIAAVTDQVRAAGGTGALAASLAGWRERLTARGLALLDAGGALGEYARASGGGPCAGRCASSPRPAAGPSAAPRRGSPARPGASPGRPSGPG